MNTNSSFVLDAAMLGSATPEDFLAVDKAVADSHKCQGRANQSKVGCVHVVYSQGPRGPRSLSGNQLTIQQPYQIKPVNSPVPVSMSHSRPLDDGAGGGQSVGIGLDDDGINITLDMNATIDSKLRST